MSDAQRLWLDQDQGMAAGPSVSPPGPAIAAIFDDEPAPGVSLLAGDMSRFPAARMRLVHGVGLGTPISGGPWPKEWPVQQWHDGSVGEAAIAPHPVDGAPCLQLRTTSGPPAAQLMTTMIRLPAGHAHVLSWRYRTMAAAQPNCWYQLDQERTRPLRMPVSQDGWRWVQVRIPAAERERRFMASFGNGGGQPEDVLALADIALRREPDRNP